MVTDWCDICQHLTESELHAAMIQVKRTSRYLPVPADVCAAAEALRRSAASSQPAALPAATRTAEQQRQLNLHWSRRVMERLRGGSVYA